MVAVGAVGRASTRVLLDHRIVRRDRGAGRRSARDGGRGGILQQTLDLDLLETYDGRRRSRAAARRLVRLLLLPGHVDGHAARVGLRRAAHAAGHHQPAAIEAAMKQFATDKGAPGATIIRLRPDQSARDASRPGPGADETAIDAEPDPRILTVDPRMLASGRRRRALTTAAAAPRRGRARRRSRRLRHVRQDQLHRRRELRRHSRRSAGTIFGGGARVGLPLGGLFVEVGAWRFQAKASACSSPNGVIPAGHPRGRHDHADRAHRRLAVRRPCAEVLPYGGGVTSASTRKRRGFADATEDVDERFNGYHVLGGAEFRSRAGWASRAKRVDDRARRDRRIAACPAAFNETDLGGTSFRLKITIGQ